MFNELDTMTSIRLRKLCQDENIPGYSKLNKKHLVYHVKTYKLNLLIKNGMTELLALK